MFQTTKIGCSSGITMVFRANCTAGYKLH